MLEKLRLKGRGDESATDLKYDGVFDYFAGEIFNKTEKGVQDFYRVCWDWRVSENTET
jgi:hypothetical protein